MGQCESFSGSLEQTKPTDCNIANNFDPLENHQTSYDGNQQRQMQTAECVDKGFVTGCIIIDSADTLDTKNPITTDTQQSAPLLEEPSTRKEVIPPTPDKPFEQITFDDKTTRQVLQNGDI